MDLLFDLSKEDLRRMLSELEIRSGDRYKIEKQIDKLKEENNGKKKTKPDKCAEVTKEAENENYEKSSETFNNKVPEE